MTEWLNNIKTFMYDSHQFITILKMCKINKRKHVKPNNILTSWESFSEIFRVIKVFTSIAYIQDFSFYDSLIFFQYKKTIVFTTASLLHSDACLFSANEPTTFPTIC